jgi:hypothetical protein
MVGFPKTLLGGGDGEPPDATDLPELYLTFERAESEMRLKTEFAMTTWGLGDAGGNWAADLDEGIITFTNARGIASAPVQVIGTLNTLDGTWLWGWDHPSVPAPVAEHAKLAKAFGEKYELGAFTTRKIFATEEDAWTFTAIACHLTGAQGGYRGPAGTAMVFMTYGAVSLTKPSAQ